jgi:hypothetical protein
LRRQNAGDKQNRQEYQSGRKNALETEFFNQTAHCQSNEQNDDRSPPGKGRARRQHELDDKRKKKRRALRDERGN